MFSKLFSVCCAGNNTRELEVPPYAVAGGGAGGIVVVSVTIIVLGIACIYCCKRRHSTWLYSNTVW